MSDKTNEALSKAFDLIEANKLEEAQVILRPLLESDKDNPDVWWVYAHAVSDPDSARMALKNIKRLDDNYPEVDTLVKSLDEQSAKRENTPFGEPDNKEPSFLFPAAPSTLPGLSVSKDNLDDFLDDDFDTFDNEDEVEDYPDSSPPKVRNLRRLIISIAAVVLIILIGLILIANPFGTQPTVTTTIEATQQSVVENITETAQPTIEPSTVIIENTLVGTDTSPALDTSQPSVTEIATTLSLDATNTPLAFVTEEPTTSILPPTLSEMPTSEKIEAEAIIQALDGFTLPDNPVNVQQTTLGNTLLVSVCSSPGAKLRVDLPQVMDIIAKQVGSVPIGTQGLGVRLLDCTNHTTLREIAVSTTDAQAYANGILTGRDFQARWQAVASSN